MAEQAQNSKCGGGDLGFKSELFKAADKLRGNMVPSDYKHVALESFFLKYVSDSFDTKHAELLGEGGEEAAENADEYRAEIIFWVPKDASWSSFQANARHTNIGKPVDEAILSIGAEQSVEAML